MSAASYTPHSVLPSTLVDQVRRGDIVLFLGAGASFGCLNDNGDKLPLGNDLRDLLSDRFLNGEEKLRTLEEVANFSEDAVGRAELDRYLASVFLKFNPNFAIRSIPEFVWRSIFSTNYDTMVEKSFDVVSNGKQQLIKFYKDYSGMDRQISSADNPLPYFKLHGCVERLYEKDAPLVLSSSTYVDARENRPRMFQRLVDAASDYSIVFVGTKLADPHIKVLLAEVEKLNGPNRPMYYIVAPDLSSHDVSYMSSRRFTPLVMGFDEFMRSLLGAIEPKEREIFSSVVTKTHPIERHFNQNVSVPPNVMSFISDNVDFVHAGMASNEVSAHQFYKGTSTSWTPIQQNFDFRRHLYEALILRVFELQKECEHIDAILIKGVAGAGKTVFTRRLAYDLATEYAHLVLYAAPGSVLRPEPIIELYELSNKRIILFVDQASDQTSEIRELVNTLARKRVPLTLILSDSETSIGSRFSEFEDIIVENRTLRKLNSNEIGHLIGKLEQHDSLGQLKHFSPEERIKTFEELADKQLLVALYEATQGRPLEDILLEEYHRILYDDAQELYLLVCTLHRFDVPVRAGLVRRLLGISYNDFRSRFLSPLTDLVFTTMDPSSRDYCYRTRHPQIASIVFRRVLDTQSKQVDQFMFILRGLNTSYSSDNQSLKKLINFYTLRELVNSVHERRKILEAAAEVAPDDPFVLQQQAILEMNSNRGDLVTATMKLDEAQSLRPNDKSLKHTRANLLARQAEGETDWLQKQSLRQQAKSILRDASHGSDDNVYVESLKAKIANDELSDRLARLSMDSQAQNSQEVLRLVENVEKALARGQSIDPDFDNLLKQEVRLREILRGAGAGKDILAEALKNDPTAKYAAIAFSRLIRSESPDEAAKVIRAALAPRSNDKNLNQSLFETLVLFDDEFRPELKSILDKSFVPEDGNVYMHVRAIRYHFMRGEMSEVDRLKSAAARMRVEGAAAIIPRFPAPCQNQGESLWKGKVLSLAGRFGFIETMGLPDNVFFTPRNCIDDDLWDDLTIGTTVKFELAFNVKGAVATGVVLNN